jgi:hypothetical protein
MTPGLPRRKALNSLGHRSSSSPRKPEQARRLPGGSSASTSRDRLKRLLAMVLVTALPVALDCRLWIRVWQGVRPRAWDGTGHYAIAQIYDASIFPDTFGWTHAYFAGMPFPNFYPPLFYWGVGFLHHTHVLTFPSAFKFMVVIPYCSFRWRSGLWRIRLRMVTAPLPPPLPWRLFRC